MRHQRERRQQLERSALLAGKRPAGQSGADGRCEEVLLLLCLLPLRPLFLPLGASVLKPDLHLSLGEAQGRGDGVPLQH